MPSRTQILFETHDRITKDREMWMASNHLMFKPPYISFIRLEHFHQVATFPQCHLERGIIRGMNTYRFNVGACVAEYFFRNRWDNGSLLRNQAEVIQFPMHGGIQHPMQTVSIDWRKN